MGKSVVQELSLTHILKATTLSNAAFSLFVLGTLRHNAEIWLNDYPPDIQEKYGPPSPKARKMGLILAIPFFILMLGGLLWSSLRLKRLNGGRLSLKAAFINAFSLIFSVWIFDLTLLDWLMFVRHTPDFVVLPGTEGMAGYDDYAFHGKAHLRALPMLALVALAIALVTASWRQ